MNTLWLYQELSPTPSLSCIPISPVPQPRYGSCHILLAQVAVDVTSVNREPPIESASQSASWNSGATATPTTPRELRRRIRP